MVKEIEKDILSSLPELYIIVSKEGEYVDYFGGNDKESFIDIETLNGKSFSDFFDSDLEKELRNSVEISLLNDIKVYVEYSLYIPGTSAKRYYKAQISPYDKQEDTVLMSIQDVSHIKELLDRAYSLTEFDPGVSAKVLNRYSYKENKREFFAMYTDVDEYTVRLSDVKEIMMTCDHDKTANVENKVIDMINRHIVNLDSVKAILGRNSPGEYSLLIEGEPLLARSLIVNINDYFQDKVIRSRKEGLEYSLSVELGLV